MTRYLYQYKYSETGDKRHSIAVISLIRHRCFLGLSDNPDSMIGAVRGRTQADWPPIAMDRCSRLRNILRKVLINRLMYDDRFSVTWDTFIPTDYILTIRHHSITAAVTVGLISLAVFVKQTSHRVLNSLLVLNVAGNVTSNRNQIIFNKVDLDQLECITYENENNRRKINTLVHRNMIPFTSSHGHSYLVCNQRITGKVRHKWQEIATIHHFVEHHHGVEYHTDVVSSW